MRLEYLAAARAKRASLLVLALDGIGPVFSAGLVAAMLAIFLALRHFADEEAHPAPQAHADELAQKGAPSLENFGSKMLAAAAVPEAGAGDGVAEDGGAAVGPLWRVTLFAKSGGWIGIAFGALGIAVLAAPLVRGFRRRRTAYGELRMYESAVLAAVNPILIADARKPELQIVFANPAFTAFPDLECRNVAGRSIWPILESIADENAVAELRRALEGGRSIKVESNRRGPDGQERWCELQLAAMRTGSGEVSHYAFIFVDITKQKSAERALQKSDAVARAIMDQVADGLVTIDETGTIRSANLTVCRMFGYGGDELLGRNVSMLMPEPVKSAHDGYLRNYTATGRGKIIGVGPRELEAVRKDGSAIPIDLAVGTTMLDGKRIFIGSLRDISSRRSMLAALTDSEERLRALTDNVGAVVFQRVVHPDGRAEYPYISAGVHEMFGYTAREVKELPDGLLTTLHPDDAAGLIEELRRSARDLKPVDMVIRVITKSGEIKSIRSINRPHRDAGGNFVSSCIAMDVTRERELGAERDRLREQIARGRKMEALGNLAGGIAHDFNNMLVPMIGLAEITANMLPEGSAGHSNLELVQQAGLRAKGLVDKILAFSRQTPVEIVPHRLSPVVAEAMDLLRQTTPANIVLRESLRDDGATVMLDPGQIHQVLMNLVTNAIHAIGDAQGDVEVIVRDARADELSALAGGAKADRYLCLSVRDTGSGIDPKTIARIFDPFFTTKEVGKGTGLGLAMVHGIVTEHGGDIAVFSEVAKGTTINAYFPVMAECGTTDSGAPAAVGHDATSATNVRFGNA